MGSSPTQGTMIVDEDRILTYFKTYDGIRSMRVVSQDLKMNYKIQNKMMIRIRFGIYLTRN